MIFFQGSICSNLPNMFSSTVQPGAFVDNFFFGRCEENYLFLAYGGEIHVILGYKKGYDDLVIEEISSDAWVNIKFINVLRVNSFLVIFTINLFCYIYCFHFINRKTHQLVV